MSEAIKALEVKKLENGSLSVRFSNAPEKWVVIDDETVQAFIIWRILEG